MAIEAFPLDGKEKFSVLNSARIDGIALYDFLE
jgi:hypothetical protein